MSREALSVSRPGPLRLAGFLCTALGALLIGLGATRDWATVHLPNVSGTPIPPFKGVDVWEGKVALFAGISILVVMVLTRLLARRAAARGAAVAIVVLGLGVFALAASDVARADTRFRSDEGLERMARAVAEQLNLPFEDVLAQMKTVAPELTIRPAAGLYVTVAGGALAAIGGVLGFAWASRRAGPAPSDAGGDLADESDSEPATG